MYVIHTFYTSGKEDISKPYADLEDAQNARRAIIITLGNFITHVTINPI